tara:strand:- start:93 stop:434 length:342 start_codon:yes stop_codon:yes gene_type:complete
MSVLGKYTTQEAVNVEVSSVWDVQTAIDTSTGGIGTATQHVNVSDYHQVIIDTSSAIDILFDANATTNCSDANDLKLPQGVTSMKIPKGLGNVIYLHWRRDGSTNAIVRMILC